MVKRTTVGTQTSMQNLCFSTAKVKVFWGLICISLQIVFKRIDRVTLLGFVW